MDSRLKGFKDGQLLGFDGFIVCLRDPIYAVCVRSIIQVDFFCGNYLMFTNSIAGEKFFYCVVASSLN